MDIISCMMRLNLVPSPHPEVVVSRFDEALFPEFRPLFEGTEAPRFLPPGFRHDPSQASTVVVLENRSEKAITALRYRWDTVDASGTQRTSHTCSDIYSYNENEGSSRPSAIEPGVVEPGAIKIISYYCMADKSEADAVRQGGGTASFLVTPTWDLADAVERTFAMDLIVFADGEISGPDPDHYALELLSRKRVAEFVAEQVRMAVAENRDVTPILNALSMIPSWLSMDQLRLDEPVLRNTKHFAGIYLAFTRRPGDVATMREAALKRLENQPTLPKFYPPR
jgi:hypothetical protein